MPTDVNRRKVRIAESFNGHALGRRAFPKDVASLQLMQVDAVKAKKDELKIPMS